MENLSLSQFHFVQAQNLQEQELQSIQQQNDEIVSIDYEFKLIIYTFPSDEYINLSDLLFFKNSKILVLSNNQLIQISIKILEKLIKIQDLNISNEKLTLDNIWIQVSSPLSSKFNPQINFNAFFFLYNNFTLSEDQKEKDFQFIKEVIIKQFLQTVDDSLQKNIYNSNGRQLLNLLENQLNIQELDQNFQGFYDPKLIDKLLNNSELSNEKFQNQFGISNGITIRNLLLNWALKNSQQIITNDNVKTLSIEQLTKELNIDDWFCKQFQKIQNYLKDYFFYWLQFSGALNSLDRIQNQSALKSNFDGKIIEDLLIQQQSQFIITSFPKLYQYNQEFLNDITLIIDCYDSMISKVCYHAQEKITKFYKNPCPIQITRIRQYQFYRIGLNKLDNYLIENIKEYLYFSNNEYIIKIIKDKLATFLTEEIFKVSQILIQKCNKQIANYLLYDNQNIF